MVENWFQIPIYTNKIWNNKFIEGVQELFDTNKEYLDNVWMPDNDTAPTTYRDDNPDIVNSNKDISNEIYYHVRTYLKQCGYKGDEVYLCLLNSWINTYGLKDCIGYHNHGYQNTMVSGIYYIDGTGEPDNGQVCFESPAPFDVAIPHKSVSDRYKHRIYYNPIKYHMLLFPSWLRHKVTPNYSGKPRTVLSFNVEVR